jgi:hypothetical protein
MIYVLIRVTAAEDLSHLDFESVCNGDGTWVLESKERYSFNEKTSGPIKWAIEKLKFLEGQNELSKLKDVVIHVSVSLPETMDGSFSSLSKIDSQCILELARFNCTLELAVG